jgi:ribosomal subunit interface protein
MDATVEIVVTGRNVDISDHYRLLITQKLARLERYNENVSRYDVELNHENNPRQSKASQRVAIAGHRKDRTVRAEARGPDFHTALDAAVGKLEARLRRRHDRRRVHHDRHQRMAIANRRRAATPPGLRPGRHGVLHGLRACGASLRTPDAEAKDPA